MNRNSASNKEDGITCRNKDASEDIICEHKKDLSNFNHPTQFSDLHSVVLIFLINSHFLDCVVFVTPRDWLLRNISKRKAWF